MTNKTEFLSSLNDYDESDSRHDRPIQERAEDLARLAAAEGLHTFLLVPWLCGHIGTVLQGINDWRPEISLQITDDEGFVYSLNDDPYREIELTMDERDELCRSWKQLREGLSAK